MKRIFLFLLIIFLVLFAFSATASTIFNDQSSVKVCAGVYAEGIHVQRGIYSFTCDTTTDGYCLVATFFDEEHYQRFTESVSIVEGLQENAEYYQIMDNGDACNIHVETNTILLIKYGEGMLSILKIDDESSNSEAEITGMSYEEFLELMRSQELTSGEKLMTRLRYWAESNGDMDAAIAIYESSMIANGYTDDEAREILLQAQSGEEIHPFHFVDYDQYNSPAEENGLEGDTIRIRGVIEKYVKSGSKNDRIHGFVVNADGDQWLILCAQEFNGTFYGKEWGSSPERHVFEGYEDCEVEIYGEYMGFSEKFKLPIIDILTYGGMMILDKNTFVMTDNAEHYMRSRGRIMDLPWLLGAEECIQSTDPYYYK